MSRFRYAIALGSNRRHGTYGAPAAVLQAAIEVLNGIGRVESTSLVRITPALGPAGRGFANAAILLASDEEPPALLIQLKTIERLFGRRRGRRWGPRILDLDILLWSEGAWEEPVLVVPHPEFRRRLFVLQPLHDIAPDWRDPISGLTVRQLFRRLATPRPVDPSAARS